MSNPTGTVIRGAGMYITTAVTMEAMKMVKNSRPRRRK